MSPNENISTSSHKLEILKQQLSPINERYRKIKAWIILSVKNDNAAMFGIDDAGKILKYIINISERKNITLYRVFMFN